MKKVFFFVIFFCCVISAASRVAEAYESVYQFPLALSYCSSESAGGQYGVYPCTESYLHRITYTGFKNQWNPSDPIHRCQQAPGTICPVDPSGVISYGLNLQGSNVPGNLFRYYLPKGTIAAELVLYGLPANGAGATLARFGSPPTSKFPASYAQFDDFAKYPDIFPSTQYPDIQSFWNGKTIEQLKQNDWFAINQGGHITVLRDGIPLTEGNWLYINFNSYDGSRITVHTFQWYADESVYTDWYNSYTAFWLANGDPSEQATPTPTPVPSLSVTPSNQPVAKDAGTTTFSVSNTGTGTMPWTAAVTSGSWLSITSGASGTGTGTITCSFTANTSSSTRTATIRVTASGATGSPKDVTVTQSSTPVPTPTPTPTVPVPDTGQTMCFNVEGVEIACPSPGQPLYGQDANYSINPVSYTKLDGSGKALPDSATSWVMVRDNVTWLTWENKTTDGTIHDKDKKYTWYDSNPVTNGGNAGTPGDGKNTEKFVKDLNDAKYGGYSDWRLPTSKELNSIVNYARPVPTVDAAYFQNTQSDFYWSSTTYVLNTFIAWGIHFSDGSGPGYGKSYSSYVRAVRGGQLGAFDAVDSGSMDGVSSAAAGSYTNNGDGTVTDTSTGLMWEADSSSPKTTTWEKALTYCEGLKLGGFTDWRLPTIKELCSIADYNRYNPAINETVFLNTIPSFYWSSTTLAAYATYTNYAWGVDFFDGFCGYGGKFGYGYVRAVRGGRTALLAATFAASPGLWVYNPDSAAWTQIATVTPFDMIYSGSMLYGDFGAKYGISMWNGYKWLNLTLTDPENMVASGSMLYVDFGAYGLQRWDGNAWAQLTPDNPENMVASGSTLYVDFGAYGLQRWDGNAWAQLTPDNPENMVASGLTLYVDFGATGLWRWDGSAWAQLTLTNPENMVASGLTLYVDFGASGVWRWDGSTWAQLTSTNPENMVASGSTLYVDFGTSGIWRWDGAAWDQLTPANPENMVASGSMLYVDLGASGIWGWDGAKWANLKSDNPEKMVGSN